MSEGFGGLMSKDVTSVHPIGLTAVVILCIAILVVKRRWAVLPPMTMACFVPTVQKIVVLSLDFNFVRIVVLAGLIRLWLRGESRHFQWRALDKLVVAWVVSSAIVYTLQYGSFSAFVNRLGFGFDALGMYFLFRCLIRNWEDIDVIVYSVLLISIPVAAAFILENLTGRNMFSVFGGVPEITHIRQGRMRCQGAFPHPILAGCFWASLMPLFAARWWKSAKDKYWAGIGIMTTSIIVITCASSTPVLAVLSGIIGGHTFYFRRYMRQIRWGLLFILIGLHIIMKGPVWSLIARVSAVGGSTSYFRYKLIDAAIEHFGEWALLGIRSTAHWFYGSQDITNQYVLEGIRGGAITLVFFVLIIAYAFRDVGFIWRMYERDKYRLALAWALGVSLFIHCMSFIGVSYFGASNIVWYLTLAMIGSMAPLQKKHQIEFTDARLRMT